MTILNRYHFRYLQWYLPKSKIMPVQRTKVRWPFCLKNKKTDVQALDDEAEEQTIPAQEQDWSLK